MNATTTLAPTVAISATFLKSLTELPDKIMRKARDVVTKFQHNPTSPGLNYEKINAAKDKRLRSLRVDQTYRCILFKSDKGDTYILLWVDKHDDAYEWARGRTCGVNPLTGAIQVVEVAGDAPPPDSPQEKTYAPEPKDSRPGLFEAFSDTDLEQLGATDDMIPVIRAIKDEKQLETMQRRFTTQVYEALFMLACGEPFDTVLDELGIETGKQFDPDDFKAALELDSNKRHFAAISDDAELEAILDEPLAMWRVYLHPSQSKLVRANFNGPARVLGGAGTGKTVVAMHRARHLASQCAERERVLFTTFTKSLVNDIKNNLQKICSYDEIKKIDVIHLDAWCRDFLVSRNYKHAVAYGSPSAKGHPLQAKLWNQALEKLESGEFTEEFLRKEWEEVIQCHDIESFRDYARIARTGRRGRLARPRRKAIWPVFEEYRTLLDEHQFWEAPDMMRAARTILEAEGKGAGFKHIIVDEIQDFHPQAFRLLRAMIPQDQFPKNNLFLVGDGHQNIYGHHFVLSHLGIDIRGRGRRLHLNYRTPEETRRWASSILKGVEIDDMDGAIDADPAYRSILSGPDPLFKPCDSFDDEIATIRKWIDSIKEENPAHVVCLAARTNAECKDYAKALAAKGLAIHRITATRHDIPDPAPVRVATMHRIKGLEFDHVCLACLKNIDWSSMDPARLEREKCLLHVAATRTKVSLLVTAPNHVFG